MATAPSGRGSAPADASDRMKGIGPVAQLVEHRTFNAVVAGSTPARLTKTTRGFSPLASSRVVAKMCGSEFTPPSPGRWSARR
jgi:hypothetical protein